MLVGVLGLLYRRIWGRSRRDFRFTEKTLLHPAVERGYIKRDSLRRAGGCAGPAVPQNLGPLPPRLPLHREDPAASR
ncbi:hypothetical protein CTI14_69195, partial [Methylobacterium radiotolerans]